MEQVAPPETEDQRPPRSVIARLASPWTARAISTSRTLGDHRIRRVSPSGIITTVAGTGSVGTPAMVDPPLPLNFGGRARLAMDSAGRVYVTTSHAVRMLTTPACATSATPTTFAAPPGGGPLALTIQAAAGCAWSITGLPAWITASATSGSGPATVILTAAANWLAPRSATVTAAGTAVTISQT